MDWDFLVGDSKSLRYLTETILTNLKGYFRLFELELGRSFKLERLFQTT